MHTRSYMCITTKAVWKTRRCDFLQWFFQRKRHQSTKWSKWVRVRLVRRNGPGSCSRFLYYTTGMLLSQARRGTWIKKLYAFDLNGKWGLEGQVSIHNDCVPSTSQQETAVTPLFHSEVTRFAWFVMGVSVFCSTQAWIHMAHTWFRKNRNAAQCLKRSRKKTWYDREETPNVYIRNGKKCSLRLLSVACPRDVCEFWSSVFAFRMYSVYSPIGFILHSRANI